jgi:hypothetical protein
LVAGICALIGVRSLCRWRPCARFGPCRGQRRCRSCTPRGEGHAISSISVRRMTGAGLEALKAAAVQGQGVLLRAQLSTLGDPSGLVVGVLARCSSTTASALT